MISTNLAFVAISVFTFWLKTVPAHCDAHPFLCPRVSQHSNLTLGMHFNTCVISQNRPGMLPLFFGRFRQKQNRQSGWLIDPAPGCLRCTNTITSSVNCFCSERTVQPPRCVTIFHARGHRFASGFTRTGTQLPSQRSPF